MDTTAFHNNIRKLLAHLALDEDRIVAAEKVAFLEMAHHIDLPDAENEGTITVVSGTPDYEPSLDNGHDIDRITSAVFVSGTTKQPLGHWGITSYQHNYRGLAVTGIPYGYCFHADKVWLYYIPNLSGTVYFTCQEVVTDLTDFPDNYYPLMVALIKEEIFDEGSREWWAAYQKAKDLLKSFKDRMRPKFEVMPMSTHRALRVRDLNELI